MRKPAHKSLAQAAASTVDRASEVNCGDRPCETCSAVKRRDSWMITSNGTGSTWPPRGTRTCTSSTSNPTTPHISSAVKLHIACKPGVERSTAHRRWSRVSGPLCVTTTCSFRACHRPPSICACTEDALRPAPPSCVRVATPLWSARSASYAGSDTREGLRNPRRRVGEHPQTPFCQRLGVKEHPQPLTSRCLAVLPLEVGAVATRSE